MGTTKVKDVVDWPAPQRLRDVRSILSLCLYYRKFIRSFSVLAGPLFALTWKNKVFAWDETLKNLKHDFTLTPILALYKDEVPYVLDCDTCDEGNRVVLLQRKPGRKGWLPREWTFISGRAEPLRRSQGVARHCLFYKAYRNYLLGRPFQLRTEHAALQWLQRNPEPIS